MQKMSIGLQFEISKGQNAVQAEKNPADSSCNLLEIVLVRPLTNISESTDGVVGFIRLREDPDDCDVVHHAYLLVFEVLSDMFQHGNCFVVPGMSATVGAEGNGLYLPL